MTDEARRLVDILTERDPLRRSETGTERHCPRWPELRAGSGQMPGEYALLSFYEVVQLMARHRIKRVPVLDGGPLVEIVSRADLLRAITCARRRGRPDHRRQ